MAGVKQYYKKVEEAKGYIKKTKDDRNEIEKIVQQIVTNI